MLVLWLALGAAWAHPFGAKFAAHQTRMALYADHVEVTYLADVPNAIVRSAARRGADPIDATLDELATGLDLRVDGTSVPLELVERSGELLRASEQTHLFQLRFRAPLGSANHDVELTNGNLPDVPAYFQTSVEVHPDVAVRSSTLLVVKDGAVIRSLSGRWRMGDKERAVGLKIEPQTGAIDRAFRWIGGSGQTLRPLPEATPVSPTAFLRRLVWTPLGLAWVAGLAGFLGFGLRPGRWRAASLGAAVVGIGLGALSAPPTWVHGTGIVVAIVAIGMTLRRLEQASLAVLVALAVLCATGGVPGYSAVIASGGLLGSALAALAFRDRATDKVALFGLVGMAMLLAVRVL